MKQVLGLVLTVLGGAVVMSGSYALNTYPPIPVDQWFTMPMDQAQWMATILVGMLSIIGGFAVMNDNR
jgi:hypothetical protein